MRYLWSSNACCFLHALFKEFIFWDLITAEAILYLWSAVKGDLKSMWEISSQNLQWMLSLSLMWRWTVSHPGRQLFTFLVSHSFSILTSLCPALHLVIPPLPLLIPGGPIESRFHFFLMCFALGVSKLFQLDTDLLASLSFDFLGLPLSPCSALPSVRMAYEGWGKAGETPGFMSWALLQC